MPPKRKKGGAAAGKKGKGKKIKVAAAAVQREEAVRTCRNFLKVYQQRCTASSSVASPKICRDCRESVGDETAQAKFFLEPCNPLVKSQPKKTAQDGVVPSVPTTAAAPTTTMLAVLLQPLLDSWTEVNYSYMRCLHIWHLELNDESTVALALFLESSLGPNLKVLDIMDGKLSPWAINRLARSLVSSQLTVLKLDYNHLPQPNLARFCEALQGNTQLQSLSFNYCHLDSTCGEALGTLVALTRIKELSLRGNILECEGLTELLRPVIALCDSEGQPPSSLTKLYLQDNCIDSHGAHGGTFAPIISMRAMKRWVVRSPVIEEVNLDGNLIGDGGGREIREALQERKEAGHPGVKMTVTHRLSPEVFSAILDLSFSSKKKGKRKGKKKGKKK